MPIAHINSIALNYADDGPRNAPALVLAGSLGTTLELWEDVLPHLPTDLRVIRYDMRGHGRTEAPTAPYTMGTLIRDAEALLDQLKVRDCVFVGLSIGGMVAQGLAVKRLDQIGALVLSNTAARVGTAAQWQARSDAVRTGGLASIADEVTQRWFSRDFRATPKVEHWRDMLIRQPVEGYIGCSAAVAGTDFYTPTSGLRLPVLGIAGSEDGATPPDLVRETIELIPGSEFKLMRRTGHLPCVEHPALYAQHITEFLKKIAHF